MTTDDDESEESLLRRFEAEKKREKACLVRIAKRPEPTAGEEHALPSNQI